MVGSSLAQAGFAVVTGGYGGTMEAVSKGAMGAGGHVIGVTAPSLFPGRNGANPHVAELIEARSLTDRIGLMLDLSLGCIAMPGSIGTAVEIMISWNANHILRVNGLARFPVAAVGDEWRALRQALTDGLGAEDSDIHWVETSNEATRWIVQRLKPPQLGEHRLV